MSDNPENMSEKNEYSFQNSKLYQKSIKDPSVPIGLTSLLAIVGYGLYNFKNRRNKKLSLYLIHLRLAAQGSLMASITLGLLYSMTKNNWSKLWNKND